MKNAAYSLANLTEVRRLSLRKLPTSHDGLSDAQAAPAMEGKQDKTSLLLRVVKSIDGQIRRGAPLKPSAIPSLLDAIAHAKSTGIDDRKLLLENILALMSRLPPGSSLQQRVQDDVIGLFYHELPHPPVNFLPSMEVERTIPTVNPVPLNNSISAGAIGRTQVAIGGCIPSSVNGDFHGAHAHAHAHGAHVHDASASATGSGSSGARSSPLGHERGSSDSPLPSPWSSNASSPEGSRIRNVASALGDVATDVWQSTTGAATGAASRPGTAASGTDQGSAGSAAAGIATSPISAASPVLGQPKKIYSTQFRSPSGAGNNPHMPLLGAAGTPYARSVVPTHPIPPHTLPDPGLVFDLLLKRSPVPQSTNADKAESIKAEYRGQGHGQPHPSGLSSMLFGFGTIIIHSLFRTSASNPSVNLTSSYLDLSPLYGVDEDEMMGKSATPAVVDKDGKVVYPAMPATPGVRRQDGTGRIWEDVWADPRIAMMPPAVGAILVVFARNHNYLALQLLAIDEFKKYRQPDRQPTNNNAHARRDSDEFIELFPNWTEEKKRWQDEDIFNRARLINCVFFMNVILGDYLSGILGTFREASEWYLNPLEEIRKGGVTQVNRAEGNCVSIEFNLLYRWHATLSENDTTWLEKAVLSRLPTDHAARSMKTGEVEITEADFGIAAATAARSQGTDPRNWTIGGLTRTREGGFADHDIARLLHEATSTMACAYGARGIPSIMKAVEVMGIKQARKWGTCTMNEFRQFIGLKKFESFEEWNPTGDIAQTARQLYQHIDNLELYIGLMAEESKQPGDGAGLCPGYTLSRAILADAVCLTRGDRFLTTDLTPFNLTSWGFQDCARDTKNGSMGAMFSKLLFRTLPEYYPRGSIYAHFPFVTPGEMKKWLKKMDLLDKYDTTPPSHEPVRPVLTVASAKGVKRVLDDMDGFKTVYSDAMNFLTNGKGFFLAFDDVKRHAEARKMMAKALYYDGAMEKWTKFYENKTKHLIELRSFDLRRTSLEGNKTRTVNIVRDVINIVPVHWICEQIAGIPLKSDEAPNGIHTEQEMYRMIAVVFSFIFLNIEPINDWPLRENSKKVMDVLMMYIKARVDKIRGNHGKFSIKGFKDTWTHWFTGEVDESDAFYREMCKHAPESMTNEELGYNVIGTLVGGGANFAEATTHVVDFYLSPENAVHKEEIVRLSKDTSPESLQKLAGYTREALRLRPQAPGIFRKSEVAAVIEEGNDLEPVTVEKGDRIFVSLGRANRDPAIFPDPEQVNPNRKKEDYYSFGRGEHTCLGGMFTDTMIPAMIKAIFSLPNVRRGPGYTGELKRVRHDIHETENYLYINNQGTISPFAASLMIEYEEPAAASK